MPAPPAAMQSLESQTARRFAQVQPAMPRQLVQPLRQRPQMLREEAAAYVLEQALHDCERLQFRRREPQPGELERD
jgi:hypothetical protein